MYYYFLFISYTRNADSCALNKFEKLLNKEFE